jgi:hypothetical protein
VLVGAAFARLGGCLPYISLPSDWEAMAHAVAWDQNMRAFSVCMLTEQPCLGTEPGMS